METDAEVMQIQTTALVDEKFEVVVDKVVEVAMADKVSGTKSRATTVVSLDMLADIALIQTVANTRWWVFSMRKNFWV